MPETASPRAVFERLIHGITHREFDTLPDLYAEDTVVELPFEVPGPVTYRGREELRKHFAGAPGSGVTMTATNVEVHETADPETIVAEWDYHFHVESSGAELVTRNIQVLRVRDGQIVFSRDYHDHGRLAAALAR